MLLAQRHTSCWRFRVRRLWVLTAATASYLPTLHTLRDVFFGRRRRDSTMSRFQFLSNDDAADVDGPPVSPEPRAEDDTADGENAHHYMFCFGLTHVM
jgi:hypothetical protein